MGQAGRQQMAIVGGGLVGSLLSVFMARRGFDCVVFERRPDVRVPGPGAGRSINLVVTHRGLTALREVGLDEAVLQMTVPVRGRMMHSIDGELSYQPYGKDDSECNYSVSRGELNRFLVDAAEKQGVRFRFRRRLVDLGLEQAKVELEDEAGLRHLEPAPGLIVGADGAASAVRSALVETGVCDESVQALEYGYKELLIPAGPEGEYRFERDALHIWPRGRIMLMALPNRDGSFTVTLYLPLTGSDSFETIDTGGKVSRIFERQFPDAAPLIPDLHDAYMQNPTGHLGTVRCSPWHHRDRVLLAGDAAHAIVPFFGQGMNCGFEDCTVLNGLIQRNGTADWGAILPGFTRSRKPNADAIADMALENFVEMRDRVGDERFLLRKQVEHLLEQKLLGEYRSRYSMVTYSDIPYRLAFEAGLIQQAILDELCAGLVAASDVDLDRARGLIRRRLTPYLDSHSVGLDY